MTKRKVGPYTTGKLNQAIDVALHPLMRGEAKVPIMLLDASLHALAEQDPRESLLKFLKFTFPKLVDEYVKEGQRRRS